MQTLAMPRRLIAAAAALAALLAPAVGHADETSLVLPRLDVPVALGMDGKSLLMSGMVVCALGMMFGLMIYSSLRKLPVHKAMLEVSELIYETCKTYLLTQIKFVILLEAFIDRKSTRLN